MWVRFAVCIFYITLTLGAVIRNQGSFIPAGLLIAYGTCLLLVVGVIVGVVLYLNKSCYSRLELKIGSRWLGIWFVLSFLGTTLTIMFNFDDSSVLTVGFSQLLMELWVVLLWSSLVVCTLWVLRRPITEDHSVPNASFLPDQSGS
jgi:hypothetical protein